jgi:serine/threonine-protein kinase
LPSQIGRYRIERELGHGAMGVVYQAHDPDIGRAVAIKLVRADLLQGADRDEFLARFRREAQAAGRCVHPNIVALYDFAVHDGNPFLAMEYVDGIGLSEALRRAGRFTPAQAVAIVVQLLGALGAAHALGIVHRDVKPANILLMPNAQVKVTDFGISRLNTSDLTMDGRVIGTPAYMSPEQCRGENVDLRTDLFSTGSVLYELLSGVRPFPGRNATEITYQLLTTEPRDLSEFVAGVPEGLIAALRKALEKSREARFDAAQTMANALRESLRGGPSAVTASSADITAVLQTDLPSAEQIERAERALATYLGPIARILVRRVLPDIASETALWDRLATHIEDKADRDRFLARSPRGARPGTGTGTERTAASVSGSGGISRTGRLSAEQVERAERALTRQLGPIARLLVKRALPDAGTETALWDRLATHIDDPAERQAFLRRRAEG